MLSFAKKNSGQFTNQSQPAIKAFASHQTLLITQRFIHYAQRDNYHPAITNFYLLLELHILVLLLLFVSTNRF